MSRTRTPALNLPGVEWSSETPSIAALPSAPRDAIAETNRSRLAGVPFADDVVTAGSETELQVAVLGRKQDVDLPLMIEASRYFANLLKRSTAQDTPKKALRELQKYLHERSDQAWDNSWVRFARNRLTPAAQRLLDRDLRSSRKDPRSERRSDADRFLVPGDDGASRLRIPVSYLINLALADYLATDQRLSSQLVNWCTGLQRHFISDNVSPETCSFYVATLGTGANGGARLARETAERFLLTQFLVAYANQRFGLLESGQRAVVHFAPHTPLGQRQLNECISDTFYRELFTSPCLSGWDRGEEKHAYMRLCHEVLSRSQLYAAAKVRDAGLIATDLLMLPTFSSTSLSNNGIHVSLGSKRLSELAESTGPAGEKRIGDLVTKIVEHFLPLFVGTYSASPYRFDFADFHAERVLGFLPHELDFTHLRMLWRRWKGKASVKILWRAVSPTGYAAVDRILAFLFRLRGDFVPDSRLLDYLVAPLSTDESPALDGSLGNFERLKHDLAMMGVFDERLSFYALYRQRVASKAGYAGFEARYYSLCHSLLDDLGPAVDLQRFVTAWAFRKAISGELTHADIPDDPITESERRQIVFGAAIGVPTFFVRAATRNKLLLSLVACTAGTRSSGRYSGYVRIKQPQFRLALLEALRGDAELVEMLGMRETFEDLEQRLSHPERFSAAGKLTQGILDQLGAKSAMTAPARDFNLAAERYYRDDLRRRYLREAYASMSEAQADAPPLCMAARAWDGEADLPDLQALLRHTLTVIHQRSQTCSLVESMPAPPGSLK